MSHERNRHIIFLGHCCLLACLLWLSSCGTTKYLTEEQAFVKKNTITIDSDAKVKKQKQLEGNLLNIVIQKPNTRFLGLFNRRWFYYRQLKKGKLKEDKRTIYEVPSVYDTTLTNKTTKAMQNYLEERGYFNPTVTYETTIKNKQSYTNYIVRPGTLYLVDTIRYISPDTSIQRILDEISPLSVLQKGQPVANQLYEQEKRRITSHLRNNGYREFYINYIDQLASDTTGRHLLDLSLTVFPQGNEEPHQQYTIDNVNIYPYFAPYTDTAPVLMDTVIGGVHFYYPQADKFPIKPEVILKRIFLKKGDLYSQENFNKTVRNLGALGIFKFANINDQVSQDSSNKIDFNIYLPANKKLVLGVDVEIKNTFFSESSITSGNFLGGALNFSYRNRNLLRGAEDLQFSFGIGGEFRGGTNSPIFRSFDINPQIDLNIPKFSDPLGLVQLFNNIGIFGDPFYKSLLENATTRVSFGLNWTRQQDFWGFFSGDLSLGYELKNNPTRKYSVNQFGINLFNPNVGEAGRPIFESNPFLERSFNNKQLFTGLLFKEFGLVFSDRVKRNNDTWRFQFNFEQSGAEVQLANIIYNEFQSERNDTFKLFNLDYAKFFKMELDGSYYIFLRTGHTLALRANAGYAQPYGSSADVPYIKQFFAGGPTSIRAWKIRELGPGAYQDPSTFPIYSENSTPFYQTGDIKFIFSAEYRFKMFKLYALDLEGAVFLDGGNVWTLRADASRPGAEFNIASFWDQIALGTGVGFRMDFDYFKLALDLGYRVRNPYENAEGSHWAYLRWRELKLRGINYNLSVGYPF